MRSVAAAVAAPVEKVIGPGFPVHVEVGYRDKGHRHTSFQQVV